MTELNGTVMPERIWLICWPHTGDVNWTTELDPDDADEYETVEYVRADTIARLTNPAEPTSEMIEEARNEMHKRFPKHDSMAMQGASNNALHYSIEADARRTGADAALNYLLAMTKGGGNVG